MIPFNINATTLPIAVTGTASASTALPQTGTSLRLINTGASNAYVHVTDGVALATLPVAGVATTTSAVVLAGQDASFSIRSIPLNISVIGDGSTTVLAQVGGGI